VILSLVMSASFLAANPALAVSANSLPYTHGHTCSSFGKTTFPQIDICVEVAVYYPSNAGMTDTVYIVPQIEAICQYSSGNYDYCTSAAVWGEVSKGTYTTSQGSADCFSPNVNQGTPYCEAGRNYFDLLGQSIPITFGSCADNVWATVVGSDTGDKTNIYYATAGGDAVVSSSNYGTAHYNVCIPASGGAPVWS
jgi:hypothetical protein